MNSASNIIPKLISETLSLPLKSIEGVLSLLDEGATVPFISRYRKERTGGLDEVAVGDIKEKYEKLTEIGRRKETVLETIREQGKLTDQLEEKIRDCYSATELEDIYLPYKPKRRTRATVAKEKGLEPLAALIMRQDGSNPLHLATKFLTNEVESEKDAIAGASDIIAEWVSESPAARSSIRRLFDREAEIISKVIKGKEEAGNKYSDYFGKTEPLRKTPSHRILAMFRGEKEGILRLSVTPSEDKALAILDRIFIKGNSPAKGIIEDAVTDSYKRLLGPSIETETKSSAKERADTQAIEVFAKNMRQLLLAPPLHGKKVLAIDPGFRTGCKLVCLSENGTFLTNTTIYPHAPQNEYSKAIEIVKGLVSKYDIGAIAIGDGTAGRETEKLAREIDFDKPVRIFTVSEDGASIYSASETAREEFPDQDVTVRGAISIGRRLIDPLAELVKIDPKSIGVGQYQHDVDQGKLKTSLDNVVESCVNLVGVELNTASKHLLTYVSGLNETTAKNIVEYRLKNGLFKSRQELKKVPRLGPKAFEQCAGFLRIADAENMLDSSAVHPESYPIVEKMAKDLNVSVEGLIHNENLRKSIDPRNYITDQTGLPTIMDILSELEKPGRDPRGEVSDFKFDDNVRTIDDLRSGMELPGKVTNITDFGAFVDIGVKQDGLVHISHLADSYISHPSDVVKLQQSVKVKVLDIDYDRGRIGLSMKGIIQ